MLLVVTVVTIAERLRNFGLHMDPRHVQLMLSPRHTDTQTYTKTSIHTELLAAEYEYTRNRTRMDGQQHVDTNRAVGCDGSEPLIMRLEKASRHVDRCAPTFDCFPVEA